MMSTLSIRATELDFDFRPDTYWNRETDSEAKKRETYAGMTIDFEAVQKSFYGLQPHFLSGADLPPFSRTGVEIVRLRLAKTIHEEVTSVRARRVGDRIAYRIVDELTTPEGGRFCIHPQTSRRPLTLGQITSLMDSAEMCLEDEPLQTGLVAGCWDEQFTLGNNEIGTLRTWVAVTSVFYPQLGSYYDRLFVEWATAKRLLPGISVA
jgi:hypothetical protein